MSSKVINVVIFAFTHAVAIPNTVRITGVSALAGWLWPTMCITSESLRDRLSC